MKERESSLRIETLAVHGGQEADPLTGARAVHISNHCLPSCTSGPIGLPQKPFLYYNPETDIKRGGRIL